MTYEEAMRKALACLKLAERGGTPEESALAASKAQEIIDRYGLDVNSADFDSNDAAKDKEEIKDFGFSDPLDSTNKLDGWWCMRLMSYLCRYNATMGYIQNNGDRGRVLMILGKPSDVQTVRYLYGYLKNEVKRLQSLNCRGNSPTYKYQYGLGVVDTIGNKLHQQHAETQAAVKQENAGNSMALVRIDRALAKQEERKQQVSKWAEENKNFRKGRASGQTRSGDGYAARAAGRRDGESIRVEWVAPGRPWAAVNGKSTNMSTPKPSFKEPVSPSELAILKRVALLLDVGNPHAANEELADLIEQTSGAYDAWDIATACSNWIDLGQPKKALHHLAGKINRLT